MSTIPKRAISIIVSLVVAVFFIHTVVYAIIVTTSGTVTITAEVSGTGTNAGGGGGGSAATPGPLAGTPTVVNFSGMAYPSSKVVILQDGVQVLTTTADVNANFSAALSNLQQGSYTFSIYTEDSNGLHSVSFSFPVYVMTGTTVNVGDIVLAPTINVDKPQVKRGDLEAIFGFAAPNSQVNISVYSDSEHLVTATTSRTGVYLYNFDTTPLEYGVHNAQSHSIIVNKISAETDPVSFIVATTNQAIAPTNCSASIGDTNCDKKVNLVDFSVMAYWYKKGGTPPKNVDLNHDGKIDLIDFSILAYHWTG
jgi:hypothetical protein